MTRELTEEEKIQILKNHAIYGDKWTLIGRLANRAESTVRSFIKSYRKNNKLFPKRGPKFTITDEQKKDVVDITLNMPEIDLFTLEDIVGISHTSCKTILNKNNINYTQKSKITPLTDLHKVRRTNFCRYWMNFNYPLPAIIFSDESTVISDRATKGIWRLRGFQHPDYFVEKVQHPKTVMVWGAIGPFGFRTPLIWCRGKVTAQAYIEMLRRNNIFALCRAHFPAFIFQQDNAPAHSARHTKAFLSTQCPVLDWPSKSPDLSPIEQLWDYIKNCIEGETFASEAALFARLSSVWASIPDDVVRVDDKSPQ